MTLRATSPLLLVPCLAVGWLSAASTLFVWLAGLAAYYPRPWLSWVWVTYLLAPKDTVWAAVYLVGSAAPATLIYLAAGLTLWRPAMRRARLRRRARAGAIPLERGLSDNHGHADWMSMAELRKLFDGSDHGHGGKVVGEAYRVDQDGVATVRFDPHDQRTWGQGGRAPLLIDPCRDGSTHSLIFSGSGKFKTSCSVTTLLHWTGSTVVLDPSCEMGPMLRRVREGMGHRVFELSLTTASGVGVNVLDWIDITDPLAESRIHSVVSWICGTPSKNADDNAKFFASRGRQLIACFLADMLWNTAIAPEKTTLRSLYHEEIAVSERRLNARLGDIHRTSRSHMARAIAGTLMDMAAEETFSGICSNAQESLSWLSTRAYADLVSGNSFRTTDLAGGHLTVFIQVPSEALDTNPAVARTLIGALLNGMFRANGRANGRCLFKIDEAVHLGDMAVLRRARDEGRKYRISLELDYQSIGQLGDIWGEGGSRAWYDSVSWLAYAAIQDRKTAEEVSAAFGTYAVVSYSDGDNSGQQGGFGNRSRGQNTTRQEAKRDLISPAELRQDARDDEMFVLMRGRPIRCGRAIYFRRPEAAALVDANRFADA